MICQKNVCDLLLWRGCDIQLGWMKARKDALHLHGRPLARLPHTALHAESDGETTEKESQCYVAMKISFEASQQVPLG